MTNAANITADAVALQERDEFREAGWLKLIAPAKVNLHLAIGARRDDGYHDVATVLHALMLHDVMYLRRKLPDAPDFGSGEPAVRMVGTADVPVPDVASADNIAAKAVVRLAEALGLPKREADLELRIEKNIPAQGGLGGGSADAAAALVGAAQLWGVPADDPTIAATARSLGADVAFFLTGGCAYFEGVGDELVRVLNPSKRAVALVKPEGGVSTPEAYRQFDSAPLEVPAEVAAQVCQAGVACDVRLFNNLAPAAEALLPALAEVRAWLEGQPGVESALLSGSGAATFAVCDDFAAACSVVAAARKKGWWARATSFSSARAMAVSGAAGTASGAGFVASARGMS